MGRCHRHKIEQKKYAILFHVGLPGGSVVKNIPAKAEEVGSIPGSGRAPGERKMATHSSILVWEIPWTEEPGGL